MKRNGSALLLSSTVFLAVLHVALAIIGGVRGYSPVPFWDMWDGYLDFYTLLREHPGWHAWWAQHNEHRIVLARMLFWMDLAWFGGKSGFLIIVNYALVALSCLLFTRMLRERLPEQTPRGTGAALALLLCAWLFNWSQRENFTWAFQSQFFLAQIVPLAAFYCLHRSALAGNGNGSTSNCWFTCACALGVASLGTMANGVLALPLLAFMALLLHLPGARVAALSMLALAGAALYFWNYEPIAHHGSLTKTLAEMPWSLAIFLFGYVGGPFHYFLGGSRIAQFMGFVLIAACTWLAWRELRSRKRDSLSLALLFFILYVGGTAFGTAGGRTVFGVEEALTSRYMTPALMAWAALFVLMLPIALRRVSLHSLLPMAWAALALVLLLPYQLNARKNQDDMRRERMVAALSLELGVKDDKSLRRIYYNFDKAPQIVERARAANTTVFADYPLAGLHKTLARPYTGRNPDAVCEGGVESWNSIVTDGRYDQIRGWMFGPRNGKTPRSITIVSEGIVVGHAIGGIRRKDLANKHSLPSRTAAFEGYLNKELAGAAITLVGDSPDCSLQLGYHAVPYVQVPFSGDTSLVTVGSDQILEPGWHGSDFDRSALPALRVVGSFVNSDSDTGSIGLQLRKGDALLLRTGPSAAGQNVIIGNVPYPLPQAQEWTLLRFDSPSLPERFTAYFEDAGTDWGRWSAIAVKDSSR